MLSIIVSLALAVPPQATLPASAKPPQSTLCPCLVCTCNGCACGDKCDPPKQTVDPPVLRPVVAAPACQVINGRLVCPTPQRYAPKTATVIRRR
jgi:hypothetical protein